MSALFKTKRMVGSCEQFFEALQAKFGEQYKVEFIRADSGVKKFFTGQTSDYITIKKNAYHAASIGVSPVSDMIDYQTITYGSFVPNTIVRETIGDSGLVNIFVARLIWGKGSDFYGAIEEFIKSEYEATEVDMGLTNSIKQMMKGKTVMDD